MTAPHSLDPLTTLIQSQSTRYPAMGAQDVYKLLHQSVFGVGHSIPNRKTAREWLEHEAGLIQPLQDSPNGGGEGYFGLSLIESVHPNGEIVRLHLRPYLAGNGKLLSLLDAYTRSADAITGDDAKMAAHWERFSAMLIPGGALFGRFDPREVSLIGKIHKADGWASVHHSPAYIQRYNPVYRILTRALAETLCRDQALRFQVS